jgi:hypothetical protein
VKTATSRSMQIEGRSLKYSTTNHMTLFVAAVSSVYYKHYSKHLLGL